MWISLEYQIFCCCTSIYHPLILFIVLCWVLVGLIVDDNDENILLVVVYQITLPVWLRLTRDIYRLPHKYSSMNFEAKVKIIHWVDANLSFTVHMSLLLPLSTQWSKVISLKIVNLLDKMQSEPSRSQTADNDSELVRKDFQLTACKIYIKEQEKNQPANRTIIIS